MEFVVENNRIYAENNDKNIVAEINFPTAEEGVVSINRTYVHESLRGQGVASKLMTAAYEEIKSTGRNANAQCSYAVEWFAKNVDKQDILVK